jgi:hypothetical protein
MYFERQSCVTTLAQGGGGAAKRKNQKHQVVRRDRRTDTTTTSTLEKLKCYPHYLLQSTYRGSDTVEVLIALRNSSTCCLTITRTECSFCSGVTGRRPIHSCHELYVRMCHQQLPRQRPSSRGGKVRYQQFYRTCSSMSVLLSLSTTPWIIINFQQTKIQHVFKTHR